MSLPMQDVSCAGPLAGIWVRVQLPSTSGHCILSAASETWVFL